MDKKKRSKRKPGRPPKGPLTEKEKELCFRMRKIREQAGMSRRELCEKVFLSQGYKMDQNSYRQYETGINHRVPEWMIEAFSSYFGIDPGFTYKDIEKIERYNEQAKRKAEIICEPAYHYLIQMISLEGGKLLYIDKDYNLIFQFHDRLKTITYTELKELVNRVFFCINELLEDNSSLES